MMSAVTNCVSYIGRICPIHNLVKSNIFKCTNLPFGYDKRYTSTLFVSGRHGSEVFQFLRPYLDFDNKVANIEKLQKELTSRGLNVNAEEIKQMWELFKSINADVSKLEARTMEVSSQMRQFYEKSQLTKEDERCFNELKTQSKILKQDWKCARNALWDVSESVVEKLLKLPNEVDQRTPFKSLVVLKRSSTLREYSGYKKDHIEIGTRLGLLEYKDPMQYYLCNEAALFELGVLNYIGTTFSADNMIDQNNGFRL